MVSSFESYISLAIYFIACFSLYFFSYPSVTSVSVLSKKYLVSSVVEGIGKMLDNLKPGESIIFSVPFTGSELKVNGTAVIASGQYSFVYMLKVRTNSFNFSGDGNYNATNLEGYVTIKNV